MLSGVRRFVDDLFGTLLITGMPKSASRCLVWQNGPSVMDLRTVIYWRGQPTLCTRCPPLSDVLHTLSSYPRRQHRPACILCHRPARGSVGNLLGCSICASCQPGSSSPQLDMIKAAGISRGSDGSDGSTLQGARGDPVCVVCG
jgi:hypothetical protein